MVYIICITVHDPIYTDPYYMGHISDISDISSLDPINMTPYMDYFWKWSQISPKIGHFPKASHFFFTLGVTIWVMDCIQYITYIVA